MILDTISLEGICILVALTIGLTEAIKRGFGVKARFIPLVALGIGMILTFLVNLGLTEFGGGLSFAGVIVLGIATGLESVGLFSGVKNLLQKR